MKNVLFLFVFSFFLSGCLFLVKTRTDRYSNGVVDSKSKGVFVSEYSIVDVNNSMTNLPFVIKEAWIEDKWYYKDQFRKIGIDEGVRNFIVKIGSIPPNDIDLFSITDEMAVIGATSRGSGGGNLVAGFDLFPDTIHFVFFGKDTVRFIKIKNKDVIIE